MWFGVVVVVGFGLFYCWFVGGWVGLVYVGIGVGLVDVGFGCWCDFGGVVCFGWLYIFRGNVFMCVCCIFCWLGGVFVDWF